MVRSKHKAISLLLAVMMVLSACFVSGFSVFAATTEESTASAGGTLVYFKNSKNWNPVNIHFWGGSEETSWPGETMSLVSGTTDIYSYEVAAGSTGIVFNGGGNSNQTGDLEVPAEGGKVYDPSTNAWSDYSGPTVPTESTAATQPTSGGSTQPTTSQPTTPGGDYVVYCQNDAGWSAVSCYMWNSGTDSNNSWPGVKMTDIGDGLWMYEMPKEYANVIFSNSGSSQTSDLVWPGNNMVYNNSTGQWSQYDASPLRVTSFTTDHASPQYTGMEIMIAADAKSKDGGTVSYQFSVTDPSGKTTVLKSFSTSNTVVWTPAAVGDYTITLDVKDTAGNTNQRTMAYSIADATLLVKPLIKAISPSNNGQIQKDAPVTVAVNAGGGNTGTKLLFYKYIVTDPNGNQNTPYYTLSNTYSFTPTVLGTYKVQAFVQGSDNQTVNKTYTYTCVGKIDPTQPTSTQPTQPTETSPTSPTEVPLQMGDVDDNGVVDIRDATCIQLYIVGELTLSDRQLKAADMDQNGKIDIRDATEIQLYVASQV